MTTNIDSNCRKNESLINSTMYYTTYGEISKLFKKIKSKGILNKKIVIDTYNAQNEELLKGDFIDKVIYYRTKKHYSPSLFANKLGIDRDTYYQYENRTFKLTNIDIIKKIVEELEMDEVDIPEYVKFITNKPLDKIQRFMDKYNISKTMLAKKTDISLRTIFGWFNKNQFNQISIKNFEKLKIYIGEELDI